MTKGGAYSTRKFLGLCRVEYPEGAFHQTATRLCNRPASPGNNRAALSILHSKGFEQLLLHSAVIRLMTQCARPRIMTKPGVRPGGRPTSFSLPKKWRELNRELNGNDGRFCRVQYP
jgi:hypothetical protein